MNLTPHQRRLSLLADLLAHHRIEINATFLNIEVFPDISFQAWCEVNGIYFYYNYDPIDEFRTSVTIILVHSPSRKQLTISDDESL